MGMCWCKDTVPGGGVGQYHTAPVTSSACMDEGRAQQCYSVMMGEEKKNGAVG
jgi:hypothetical protein